MAENPAAIAIVATESGLAASVRQGVERRRGEVRTTFCWANVYS